MCPEQREQQGSTFAVLTKREVDLLREGARLLGFPLPPQTLSKLVLFLQELRFWSRAVRLVSQSEPEVVIRKHVLDSLAITPLIPPAVRLVDLGSGAGFPGVVLAVVFPTLKVALVEARRKKANFLREVVRKAHLDHVEVFEARAEALTKREAPLREAFSLAISRATWSLKEFLKLAHPFLFPGGLALAMKGPAVQKELLELGPDLQKTGFALKERYPYVLPLGGERREAIVLEKICST